MAITELAPPAVTIGGKQYAFEKRWAGSFLSPKDGYLALDAETDLVDLKTQIPRLALLATSAGEQNSSLIHPDDTGKFILQHKSLRFICHNASFDFWVIENHLRQRQEEKARHAWWEIAASNRLHDLMLLDMLVRLAIDDAYPKPRDLAKVAQEYAGLTISKEDPYRMRYGEIIGADWDLVEDGFFEYAIKDAIVTKPAYLQLRKKAVQLLDQFGQGTDIRQEARQKFGLLTESVQVKKAIALAQITRNGMTVDLETVRQTESELRAEVIKAATKAHAICPIYKPDEHGQLLLSGKSQAPAFDDKLLREQLSKIKEQIEKETHTTLRVPVKSKGTSRSIKDWADYAHCHPFLQHWTRSQGLAKLLQFFGEFRDRVDLGQLAAELGVDAKELASVFKLQIDKGKLTFADHLLHLVPKKHEALSELNLDPERVLAVIQSQAEKTRQPSYMVHPTYNVMIRSGRTSCSAPNLQQVPRDSAFRQAFMAPAGYFMLIADYSFIELRTFAATALHRFGWSKMGDVIKAGVDPHAHTAAMMLDVPVEEFLSWKDNETVAETTVVDGREVVTRLKDKYDKARQSAKPVNFGVPGGLGVASLVSYAHSTYKVELTTEEAKNRRELLTKKIYPELDLYLAEDTALIIARNLGAPVQEVRDELGDTALSSIHKILAGDPKRLDGRPYQPTFVSSVWSSLAGLNRNPSLKDALDKRTSSPELATKVCHAGVATSSGRIRGRVRYAQARNTPFQGLAADGAALALFDLVREDFLVIGFIHDEVLTLLPDQGGYVEEATVQRFKDIMCGRMQEALMSDVPVDCDMALAERWTKKAKLIVEEGKVYPWKAPATPA